MDREASASDSGVDQFVVVVVRDPNGVAVNIYTAYDR
jgi:hypothetical protein